MTSPALPSTGVWKCRRHPEGCRSCKSKTRRHRGHGLCTRCRRKAARAGALPELVRGKTRTRCGTRERYCHLEERWLPETAFRVVRRTPRVVYETVCASCSTERRRQAYLAQRSEILARNRERWRTILQATRDADRNYQAPVVRVPAATVAGWVADWLASTPVPRPGDKPKRRSLRALAELAHVGHDTLQRVVGREVETVGFDIAEKVAGQTGALDEAYSLLPTGATGWSRESDHCVRCGRFDRPHYCRGHCLRCYALFSLYRRQGRPLPPPRGERWCYQAPDGCKRCGGRRMPHVARGLCRRCYGYFNRSARRLEIDIRTLFDQAGYPRRVESPAFDAAVAAPA
jgi:hypothetical protein